jgi:hypothetical protein
MALPNFTADMALYAAGELSHSARIRIDRQTEEAVLPQLFEAGTILIPPALCDLAPGLCNCTPSCGACQPSPDAPPPFNGIQQCVLGDCTSAIAFCQLGQMPAV